MTKNEVTSIIKSTVPDLVKTAIDAYLADLSKLEESTWSKEEGAFATATELGITDGTSPQGFLRRQEAIAIISRFDKKAELGVIYKKEA